MDRKPHYAIQEHQDALWLFVDGTPTADLEEMRLIDFGSFISVEGGLIYETLPAEEWRDKLQALGLEVGVVCGRGRNPTLRLWPAIFSGEIDVFPSERRNMGQEIGR